jgi:Tfp pilus assembly protein PilV
MQRRRTVRSDEGVTLVELLIAITIMGVAVIVLVGAMSTVVTATAQHRGHSIEETRARNFGEAIQQKAGFTTKLTSAMTAGAGSMVVSDGQGFQLTPPFYVVVDQETMQVTAGAANTLTVGRDKGGSVGNHTAGAVVTPLVSCPTATQLEPGFPQPDEAFAQIKLVEYWDPSASAFTTNRSTCTTHFATICPDDVRPECEIGLERVTVGVTIKSAFKTQLHDPATDTQVLVRRGSG